MEISRQLIGKLGTVDSESLLRAEKYIHLTGDDDIDYASICALENLRELIVMGKSNDKAKYALPECWRVKLTGTINLRSLQNFISLRSSPKALPEIQLLAKLIYESLPSDIQGLINIGSILTKELR